MPSTEKSFPLVTKTCLLAINETFLFARQKKFEFVTVDNLFYFISKTEKGKKIFNALGVDVDVLNKEILNYLEENIPKIEYVNELPQSTVAFSDLFEKAIKLLKQHSSDEKNVLDEKYLVAALFEIEENNSCVLNYFNKKNITRYDVMSYIVSNKPKEIHYNEDETKKRAETKKDLKEKPFLEKFAVLLNERVKDECFDPVIGRDLEVSNMVTILSRRKKNNPILVGDPGVGKTALVEGFVKRIISKTIPDVLQNALVYAVDFPSLLAGTKFRGEFEERLSGLIKESLSNPNIILFFDEIHNLVSSSASGMVDASNILKPYLSEGELKVIGATTSNEYKKYFEKDGALSRRFQKIVVMEPSIEDSIKILSGVKAKYEKFHGVEYTDESIASAVKLTSKYLIDRKLPDKAIDLIDLVGANVKVANIKSVVNERDVETVFSKIARIPVSAFAKSEKVILKNLGVSLKKEIFGQDLAIETVVDSVLLSRSNITEKNGPIGSFIFLGPSGVGKTELAKQLADKLGSSFIRFDMSEFMEKHSVSKMLGSPPGYVGSDNGGLLIDLVKKNPNAVLLLDEIEKAHPDIFNVLLQVMDYGIITDSLGEKADFKNIILVMTSNLGVDLISKRSIGFLGSDDKKNDLENLIKSHFSPEFFNRLTGVIKFENLTEDHVQKIVSKHLKKIKDNLLNKKIILLFGSKLVKYIAENGFDKELGARPIDRFIEKNFLNPLSKIVLFNDLENGGEIKAEVVDGKIVFNVLCSYSDNKNISIKHEKIMLKSKG
jgi:ATP-dependent Clp protease ATP-binding subunit ClpA